MDQLSKHLNTSTYQYRYLVIIKNEDWRNSKSLRYLLYKQVACIDSWHTVYGPLSTVRWFLNIELGINPENN